MTIFLSLAGLGLIVLGALMLLAFAAYYVFLFNKL